MRVKRYIVDSMPDALQKIRTELGKDAVILNTKEVKTGGIFGMFSKKKIEVIAAIDSNVPSPSLSMYKQATPSAPVDSFASAVSSVKAKAFSGAAERSLPISDSDLQSKTADQHGVRTSPPISQTADPILPTAREDRLLEELKTMKEMVHRLTRHHLADEPEAPALEEIRQLLVKQDFEPVFIEQIISGISEKYKHFDEKEPLFRERARSLLKEQLHDALSGHTDQRAIRPNSRVVHFVGPTGVGKTTTIAKLAAEQVLKHNKKVGFITSDTYRIAAVDQLKTYASILNVPLEVVLSPQELTRAFRQMADRDMIFMDTAGRNFRNEMYVSELNALLQSAGDSETFLVLSLTTKYSDMRAITGNFHKFKLDKVLFTKFDETESYGPVFNLIHEFPLQLSYITNGQNVPDDIMEFNEQWLISRILEEFPDE